MSTQCDARTPVRPMFVVWVLVSALCLALAAGIGGRFYYEVWGSQGSSDASSAAMVTSLNKKWDTAPVNNAVADPAMANVNPSDDGTPFAVMKIARFGKSWEQPIVQGTKLAELGIGVGHVPGTAMPGQLGNVSLAGHRTTYGRPFNKIAEMKRGDVITIDTSTATYAYKMVSSKTVLPNEVDVFAPVPGKPKSKVTQPWLSMSSCTPEYSATHRYIVHALLVKTVRK